MVLYKGVSNLILWDLSDLPTKLFTSFCLCLGPSVSGLSWSLSYFRMDTRKRLRALDKDVRFSKRFFIIVTKKFVEVSFNFWQYILQGVILQHLLHQLNFCHDIMLRPWQKSPAQDLRNKKHKITANSVWLTKFPLFSCSWPKRGTRAYVLIHYYAFSFIVVVLCCIFFLCLIYTITNMQRIKIYPGKLNSA